MRLPRGGDQGCDGPLSERVHSRVLRRDVGQQQIRLLGVVGEDLPVLVDAVRDACSSHSANRSCSSARARFGSEA